LESWRPNGWAHLEDGSLGVREQMILSSPHTSTPPHNLELGKALGMSPVLTSCSQSQKALKVAPPQSPWKRQPIMQVPYRRIHKEGRCKQQVSNCLPCHSGHHLNSILGFRVASVLPIICLSLRIHRATEVVAKPPEHPQ
jgi:hypothetical protein